MARNEYLIHAELGTMERGHYIGFTPEQKRSVHERAQSSCEFPAGCETGQKNNGIVHHLTGSYEAQLSRQPMQGKEFVVFKDDMRPIHDPTLNALMLCEPHAVQHDIQEAFQVASLEAAIHKQGRIGNRFEYRKSTTVHRRRRR
jgi:hypothetical protein